MDFKLIYDLFDNKYGPDWFPHYEKELKWKKNPSSKPKNHKYPTLPKYPWLYPEEALKPVELEWDKEAKKKYDDRVANHYKTHGPP